MLSFCNCYNYKLPKYLAVFTVYVFLFLSNINAQTIDQYTFTAVTGTLVENSSYTVIHGKNADDALSPAISIGFDFEYEGITYTEIKVSTNGWLTFNTSIINSYLTNNLTAPSERPIIAPLWDDLKCSGNNGHHYCNYELSGIAPNRVLTVEWHKTRWDYGSKNNVCIIQCKLYETTNAIQFVTEKTNNLPTFPSASMGLTGITSGFVSVQSSDPSVATTSTLLEALIVDVEDDAVFTFTPPSANTWTGAGDPTQWNDDANWSSGVAPTSSTDISFTTAFTNPADNITNGGDCNNITIDPSVAFTLNGANLNVSGDFTQDAELITIASGSAISVTGTSTIRSGSQIDISGTFNANSDFVATGAIVQMASGANLYLVGSSSWGTLNESTGTITYAGTSAQNLVSDTYYNLSIDGASTKTAVGAINVDGDLNTANTASCILDLGANALNVAGNLTVGYEGGLDASDISCVVTFDGASIMTHAGSLSYTYANSTDDPDGVELNNDRELLQYLYDYGYSRSIALSSDLNNEASEINSIDLYVSSMVAASYTFNNVTILIKNIGSTTSFSLSDATNGYPSEAGYATVFSGDVTIDALGWNTITFDNPYVYSGSGSIEIIIKNEDGAFGSNGPFFAYGNDLTPDARMITDYQDGSFPTTASGNAGSYYNKYLMRYNKTIISSATSINPTFTDVTINGSDLTLASKMDVTGNLTFTSGDIVCDDVNGFNLTLDVDAKVAAASASSHVVGQMDVKTNSSSITYTFPIGDGTRYRPVIVSPNAATATTYTAKFYSAAYGNLTCVDNATSVLDHVAPGSYWDITNNGGSDADIGLNWDATSGVDTPTDIRLAHWNSGTSVWEAVGVSITASDGSGDQTSATAADGRVTGLGISSFSPFNLGSSGGGNSLPIDLLSFSAECSHDVVDVNFTVVSQVNNDYFLIERSEDALNWEELGILDGEGTSNIQMDYSLVDSDPISGLSYYRLSQVDHNGFTKTFNPVVAQCGANSSTGLSVGVYPNPVDNEFTFDIELDEYQGDNVYYTIVDIRGAVVASEKINLDRGYNKQTIDVNGLSTGVYILRFNNTRNYISERRIVKR